MTIRAWRRARGYSQKKLAELMDVTAQTIRRWESGETEIGAVKAAKICDILDITMDDVDFFAQK